MIIKPKNVSDLTNRIDLLLLFLIKCFMIDLAVLCLYFFIRYSYVCLMCLDMLPLAYIFQIQSKNFKSSIAIIIF